MYDFRTYTYIPLAIKEHIVDMHIVVEREVKNTEAYLYYHKLFQ